jgi:hypothetical protein
MGSLDAVRQINLVQIPVAWQQFACRLRTCLYTLALNKSARFLKFSSSTGELLHINALNLATSPVVASVAGASVAAGQRWQRELPHQGLR